MFVLRSTYNAMKEDRDDLEADWLEEHNKRRNLEQELREYKLEEATKR